MRFLIFLSTVVLVTATANKADPAPPRSVNVALETSFLFDPNDLHNNKYVVTNLREFLNRLLKVLEPKKQRKSFRANSKERPDSLKQDDNTDSSSLKDVLDYVKNVGQTFVNLTGTKLKEVVKNIQVQVVTEKGAVEVEPAMVTDKPEKVKAKHNNKNDVKEIISSSINNWMKKYPNEMKSIMNTKIHADTPIITSFTRRLNNYYSDEDMKKLKKLINKFKKNIENKEDATEVVKELLHNAIFKKYSSLNETTKFALMEDLRTFSEFLIANNVFKDLSKHVDLLTRRSGSNADVGEIRNIDDINYTNLRRSIDNKLKDAIEKKIDEKKKSGTNEIVVDSVEFLMESNRKP